MRLSHKGTTQTRIIMSSNAQSASKENEDNDTLCGHRDCESCRAWREENEHYRRQRALDHETSSAEQECKSCSSHFRGPRYQNGPWINEQIKKSFAELEESAGRERCRSCRLFRQVILYESPALEDYQWLRSRSSNVIISEGVDYLWVSGGRRRDTKLDLADVYTAITQPSFDVEEVLQSATAMLGTCTSKDAHASCSINSKASTMPTRVIDVGSKTRTPSLFVTEGRTGRYCTLSYCWGDGNSWFSTTRNNIESRTLSLPFASHGRSMPKTYHDAIVTTRRLGIRYIWIDALCIVQDDLEDWQRESARMADIYQRSFCTIAATGGKSSIAGFLNSRRAQQFGFDTYDFRNVRPLRTEPDRHIIPPRPHKASLIACGPLNSRGWVFQERLLSSRTLHFTPHCLYFECQMGTISELDFQHHISEEEDFFEPSVKSMRQLLLNKGTLDPTLTHEIWSRIMCQYTTTNLTYDSDRLLAISGIVSSLAGSLNDRYLAGLWRNHITHDLQWVLPRRKLQLPVWKYRRPKAYVAPSWSWASIIGPVSIANDFLLHWETKLEMESDWDEGRSTLELVDVQIDLVNHNNPFGQVKSGSLRVRARVIPLSLISQASKVGTSVPGVALFCDKSRWEFDQEWKCNKLIIFDDDDIPCAIEDLWCMEVYRYNRVQPLHSHSDQPSVVNTLVLSPTVEKNQFCRVGFARLMDREYVKDWEEKLIEII